MTPSPPSSPDDRSSRSPQAGPATTSESDFAPTDYQLKIEYLTSHFERMWNRFNYFVAIETALVGANILAPENKPTYLFAVAGVLISAVWYVMGAEDRYLVRLYRDQVKRAARALAPSVGPDGNASIPYRHVGEVSRAARQELRETESRDDQGNEKSSLRRWLQLDWLSGWRWEPVSTTRLASLIPLLLLALWIIALVSVRSGQAATLPANH